MSNPYAAKLNTVVFDIETMGLSPGKDMVINAGFYYVNNNDFKQLFAESPADEKKLIENIIEILSGSDAVISYNGDSFDIPFIQTRAKKYGILFNPKFWSIDMYRYLKKYWPMAARMPHLNQKSVEIALGLSDDRADLIGGGECISLYSEYIRTGNPESKRLILLHNADDVKQLAKIYHSSNFLEYDKIAFERGFAVKARDLILINSIRLDKNYIYVDAKKNSGGIPSSIFDDAYQLEYDCISGDINLKLNYSNKDGLSYLDLCKLPCDRSALSILQGFHSDFLVVADKNGIMYKEVNALIESILSFDGLF